ncbi:T9SS type B sorting domain-containing protein [Flavivirga spongiicola]|uniref:T9SS type B sorting domain-containing protein n=1 Tax=Flavivirga spongiicola TaxID=421621 RepID=A0ABU7XNP7_9FLAO|nr:T9SS type B sorting domain-containing protein [Flavivirga sp. MEBiC05379]MDO5981810.1 T9SS type B sorting domain-containing protein [Flavivirga sp. MEBiC05379]
MFCRISTLLMLLVFFVIANSSAQNIAPTLSATGNQVYCPLSQINIVTDFNIVDPDDTGIDALFVQISTGYQSGEDTLLLTGTHPNIITSWNALEGKLTLEGMVAGPVSYVDLIAAIKDVVLQSTSTSPLDKSFSITIGDANYLPSTDHYYEYVPSLGITWTDAKTAAEARTYFGIKGYLATITSPEEAQLSGEQAAGAGWIGGSDAGTEGVWKWVTGPEAGTIFWNGGINGSTPNYANWNTGEPNQVGDEDYAHVTAPNVGRAGSWNDLSNTGAPSGDYQPKGYIVEYGSPSEPSLNISASTSIYTASIIDNKGSSRCGDGTVTIEATPSLGATVFWYDSAIGGTQLGSGNLFTTPVISTTTTYYAYASINGCLEGDRTPVLAEIITIPTILSVDDAIVCESGSGVLRATSSSGVVNWYASLTGGASLFTGNNFTTPVLSNTATYYVDATFNGCTTASRTPVTLTVQKTPPPIASVLQTFCDIQDATISDLIVTGIAIQWYTTSTGSVPLDSTEKLTNTTYYAAQTINNCESVLRFAVDVEVYETVEALQPANIPILHACDTDVDGDDTNGFSTFDLTLNEAILLNGKTAADFTFSYFIDTAYNTPIPTPSNAFENTIKDGQTIYVRISNNIDSNCYTDISFDIEVDVLPVIQSAIVFKNCDEDGTPDGITDFNLNEANDVITNNNASNLTITYHLSMIGANTDTDMVNNAMLFNNSTANTVYARVENPSGCYRISTVNLQVSTTSFPLNYFETLEFCDDDDTIDGLREFDLTQASALFIAQFPLGQNLSVHYFRNLSDAQLEQNEIVTQTNYVNEESFEQILYVRVESDDNGDCFGLGPHLVLKVNPRPEFEVDQTETYCLDNNPITLTTFNPNGNYTYEWQDEDGAVVSNSSDATVVSGGTYNVIATSGFGCESFPVSFTVVESAKASIDIDDITIVELSDNNSIAINNDNNNLGIGDYEFALDNEFGSYQDEPFFDQVGAGSHTVYVRDKKKCGIAKLDVFILGFPKFFTPNNDGSNDTWQIKGIETDFSNASVVNVYDRYGKLVKQLNAKNGKWDGTFNGSQLPTSDYWFVAQLIDQTGVKRIYRGHFSLIN